MAARPSAPARRAFDWLVFSRVGCERGGKKKKWRRERWGMEAGVNDEISVEGGEGPQGLSAELSR